ncbi:MAG: aspartate/glutamate racemase family protein [Methanomicrobiales archaeon]
MKTIGLLGGMSWESSLEYYRIMNEAVRDRLGGLHSARCILYSVEFGEIQPLLEGGRYDELEAALCAGAASLGRAGADLVLIATNTMHLFADAVEEAAGVPLVHIADATGEAIARAGLRTVALLGTSVTMEGDFYRRRLEERYGIRTIVPGDRAAFDRIIFDELCQGIVRDPARKQVEAAIDDCVSRGAQGVILGCTELPLLVSRAPVPLFDTTRIHAQAAVTLALERDRPR